MNFKTFFLLGLVCLVSACGKDDKNADSQSASAIPVKTFNEISGLSDSPNSQNTCPYVELKGSYKVSSSECFYGTKKVDFDGVLVPSQYVISQLSDNSGSIEAQFTGEGAEVPPFALDFPRIQTRLVTRKLGVQCDVDSEQGTLKLYQACLGGAAGGSCFYAVVKKGKKLFAYTSRMRKGNQYWCRSNLRKVDAIL
ncbi:MAG: hypothetical protein ACXWQO_05800 [Bdellovibrionota bacterium]